METKAKAKKLRVKTKTYKLYLSDNMEALADLKDCSMDSVVCDPPYGLSSKEPDAMEMMKQWYKHGIYKHGSKGGFMGNSWDSFVPQPLFWKEVFRVLKPGGHVLAFFGTRTHDLGTLAIRLAGFQIRDTIMWVYGSGFPKSLNIEKQLSRAGHESSSSSSSSSDWSGWGTALKPALEPIVMARKPLAGGTVGDNVTAYGTGGINIDGCRVGFSDMDDSRVGKEYRHAASASYTPGQKKQNSGDTQALHNKKGRFPANLIHDGSALVESQFGGKTSVSTGGQGAASKNGLMGNVYGGGWNGESGSSLGGLGDSGSVSRFFYCAKASAKDKNEGLDDFESSSDQVAYSKGRANCLARCAEHDASLPSGSTAYACGCALQFDKAQVGRRTGTKNIHPTVKPTELMRYLCRLVTPPNGIVLDPFMGSGSTGKAALMEGFRFVGMEMDAVSFATARARIQHSAALTASKPLKSLF